MWPHDLLMLSCSSAVSRRGCCTVAPTCSVLFWSGMVWFWFWFGLPQFSLRLWEETEDGGGADDSVWISEWLKDRRWVNLTDLFRFLNEYTVSGTCWCRTVRCWTQERSAAQAPAESPPGPGELWVLASVCLQVCWSPNTWSVVQVFIWSIRLWEEQTLHSVRLVDWPFKNQNQNQT